MSSTILAKKRNQITDQGHLFNLQSDYLIAYRAAIRENAIYSQWTLSDDAANSLEHVGIRYNTEAIKGHGHPACKTIEEYILCVSIPSLIDADCTVLWSKPAKLQRLANLTNRNVISMNVSINPKDYTRYINYSSDLPEIETTLAFIHDSAHFLNPIDIMMMFSKSSTLSTIYATVIIPPELIDELPSMNPEIYTYKNGKDHFEFYPDGHVAGGYSQPKSGLWWFKNNRIVGPEHTLVIQKLDSYYAHHIFMITKMPCAPPERISFQFKDRVELPKEAIEYFQGKYRVTHKKLYKTVVNYALSVTTVTESQVNARARQTAVTIKPEPTQTEQLVAVQYGVALNKTNLKFIPDTLPIVWPHHLVTRMGPIRWIRLLLNAAHRKAWESFLTQLDPVQYTATQTLEMYKITDYDKRRLTLTGQINTMTYRDLLNLLDAVFAGDAQVSETLNGNASYELPYASDFVVKHVLRRYLPTFLTAKHAYKFIKYVVSWLPVLYRNKRTLLLISPAILLGAIVVKYAVYHGYFKVEGELINLVHGLGLDGLLPAKARAIYRNVKLAARPVLLDSSTTPIVTYTGIKEMITPEQVPTTGLLNEILDKVLTPNIHYGAMKHKPDEIWSCANKECKQHTINEDSSYRYNGYEWNTCAQGHGYYGEKGGKCHVCIERLMKMEQAADDLLDGYPQNLTQITHERVDNSYTCTLRPNKDGNSEYDCPGCFGHNIRPEQQPPKMRSKNNCLFDAVHDATKISTENLWKRYAIANDRAEAMSKDQESGWNEGDAEFLAYRNGLRIEIINHKEGGSNYYLGPKDAQQVTIHYRPGHYYYEEPKLNGNGKIQKELLNYEGKWKQYRPNFKRAENFLRNIKNNKYGIHLPFEKDFIKRAESVCQARNTTRAVKMIAIYGLPGTGKTHPCMETLSKVSMDNDIYRVIFPTQELRGNTVHKLKLESGYGFKAPTPETPFLQSHAQLVVGEECGKFPPGYFDLLILMSPGIEYIILTGDPTQTVYHCSSLDNTLNQQVPEIDHYSKYAICYLTKCRRFTCGVAHAYGLDHDCNLGKKKKGNYSVSKKGLSTQRIVLAGELTVRAYLEQGIKATTFSGSQGSSYDEHYSVQVDKHSAIADDRAWFTAITRGERGINIIVPDSKVDHHKSAIARAIIDKNETGLKEAIQNHIARYAPKHLLDPFKAQLNGNGKVTREVNTSTLPHLSGILDETPEPEYTKETSPEPSIAVEQVKNPFIRGMYDKLNHGQNALEQLIGISIPEIVEGTEREIMIGDLMTQQVEDKTILHGAFLKHKRGDKATEDYTLRGRWKNPSEDKPLKTTVEAGTLLFTAFTKTYGITYTEWNEEEYNECRKIDQEKFVSKGYKVLYNIRNRCDPDWFDNHVEMFTKQQAITKPGTLNRAAKMGQLVISFNTYANFRFGPLARYCRAQLRKILPEHFFFLDEKNDRDLSEFVIRHWDFSKDSTEDDYTAFDQSQGSEFLNFDAQFMRALNVPEYMISDYLDFMCSLEAWCGKMGIVMPSGCKFTLGFNSTRSAAYQALKYKIKPGTPICITGDDVACNDTPPERDSWKRISTGFSLVSKRATKRLPTFCGWIMSPAGCFKDPELLLHRTMYQMTRNNLSKCFYSYAADYTPFRQNFEIMAEYITEEQMEAAFTTAQILHAEAKRCGIKLQGNFETTYGATRHYNLVDGVHSIKLQ